MNIKLEGLSIYRTLDTIEVDKGTTMKQKPKHVCENCRTTFVEDPDPKYGDCPHCNFAGDVRPIRENEETDIRQHMEIRGCKVTLDKINNKWYSSTWIDGDYKGECGPMKTKAEVIKLTRSEIRNCIDIGQIVQ